MTNSPQYQDALTQDRFGLKIAARLSDASEDLPHAVSERLRAARVQALGRRKVAVVRSARVLAGANGGASLTLGDDDFHWWNWIGTAIPAIALVVGLVAINVVQSDSRAVELAEVDVALLTDDLPPAAYTEPGFTQFLRSLTEPTQ